MTIKNEPDRLAKKNQNFQNEVDVLKEQIGRLEGQIEKDEKTRAKRLEEYKRQDERKTELVNDTKSKRGEIEVLTNDNADKTKQLDRVEAETNLMRSHRAEIENLNADLVAEKKRIQKDSSTIQKQIEAKKKQFKEYSLQIMNYKNQSMELKTQ